MKNYIYILGIFVGITMVSCGTESKTANEKTDSTKVSIDTMEVKRDTTSNSLAINW